MSKFIDALKRISKVPPRPIGFGVSRESGSKSGIQLVAYVPQEQLEQLAEYAIGADAVVLGVTSGLDTQALEKISDGAKGMPWGAYLGGDARQDLKVMLKSGCDFLVLPPDSSNIEAGDEGIERIIQLDTSISDSLLRAVNELPVAAIWVVPDNKSGYSLTWHQLMVFQRFSDISSKPVMVSVPDNSGSDELKMLWKVGVNAVVVDVTGSGQNLKDLRQIIDKISFPLPRKEERVEPVLPEINTVDITAADNEDEE